MAEPRMDAGLAAAAAASNPRERIEGAMAPYREALERAWGAELPALTDYLTVATAPWRQNAAVLRAELKRAPSVPTLIL
ncbi:MAG: hypothetical protein Q7R80_02750, partial [bacterium]|nr:hypothetical protein [bacterium]